jgi:beta-N-acetylhexosaminidase
VAIEDGLPAIMTAHMMVPNLDKENPASISHYITTRVLRQELGFNGVVITDDLTMAGIARRMSVGEAAVRAVKAGADIIIISKDVTKQREAINAVKEAVKTGYIPEEQLIHSLKRISDLKNKL